jgi:ABC-type lipoprotein export system ATPase subunit
MKPDAAPVVHMEQVVKTYSNEAGSFTVLKGIDLDLHPGEFVAIVGKSGSGKSTLLNMMSGIDHPTSGQVRINGVDLYAMSESKRARWRGRNLGIVFQFFQLLPALTLLENVMLPMDYADYGEFQARPQRAMELLALVGLQDQAHKLPAALSTGQQQAAAIARALANDPPLILADEATGNLDSRSADAIVSVFDSLVAEGKTLAIVTHDPSLAGHASRTVLISDGELVDESLARALPQFPHHSLLDATRLLARSQVEASEPILAQGQPVDRFYVIAGGSVRVQREHAASDPIPLAQLGPGQFFGEVELLNGGGSIAAVSADDEQPVELVSLTAQAFGDLLDGEPQARRWLTSVAEQRLRQNRASAGDS